jgi:hypothetical protein
VLKSNEPPPENRSPTGQIGPYWLYLLSLLTTCGGILLFYIPSFLSLLAIVYNLRRYFALLHSLFWGSAYFTASCLRQHKQKNIVASCVAVNNIECQTLILSGSISKNMLLPRHIGRFLFPGAGHFYQ